MRVFLTVLMLLLAALTPALAEESSGPSEGVKEEPPGLTEVKATEPAETTAKDGGKSEEKNEEYYFVVVEGKGMPVKEILVNGINVLGGSIISLAIPINVTNEIRLGLNDIKVRYVSHDSESLVTIMEKRTSGPKRTEVVKLVLPPRHSQGKEMVKELAFSIDPAPIPPAKIELTTADEQKIVKLVESYYKALNSKSASKLRSLYSPALKEEKKIFPEGAEFFSRILNKEIALMRRKEIKMGDFNSADVMLEQDGNKIKALRKDRQPMMESNEIEVEIEPILSEVNEDDKKGKKTEKEHTTAKQRLLTTTLLFKRIDKQWRLALPRGV